MRRLEGVPRSVWHEVAPGLWQGSSLGAPSAADVDAVLTLALGAPEPDGISDTLVWHFDDIEVMPDATELQAAVDWVSQRWRSGLRVLVRCHAGWNRSGLVVARVLTESGMNPDAAIAQIRQTVGSPALSNPVFADSLTAVSRVTLPPDQAVPA